MEGVCLTATAPDTGRGVFSDRAMIVDGKPGSGYTVLAAQLCGDGIAPGARLTDGDLAPAETAALFSAGGPRIGLFPPDGQKRNGTETPAARREQLRVLMHGRSALGASGLAARAAAFVGCGTDLRAAGGGKIPDDDREFMFFAVLHLSMFYRRAALRRGFNLRTDTVGSLCFYTFSAVYAGRVGEGPSAPAGSRPREPRSAALPLPSDPRKLPELRLFSEIARELGVYAEIAVGSGTEPCSVAVRLCPTGCGRDARLRAVSHAKAARASAPLPFDFSGKY